MFLHILYLLVCLFVLRPNVPVNNFSVMSELTPVRWLLYTPHSVSSSGSTESEMSKISPVNFLGPVVQSIVSLTISLRHKFVEQISAKVTNTLLFFVEKM